MTPTKTDATLASEVRTFVMDQRRHCVSDREWEFRLRGYGYGIRRTQHGSVVHSLPKGNDICALD